MQRADLSAQHWPQAALYVVATPIGNLADITLRALWVLSHADAIAAEDTRVAQQLLSRYGIALPPQGWIRAHAHTEREAGEQVCALLAGGARVALVSDAGTPALSDPGARVVQAVREAGFVVQPIAGPSSALAALSVAGFSSSDFTFLGFLPTGAQQSARALAQAARGGRLFIFFEAPHRIVHTLGALAECLAPTRRVLIARELTKRHEEIRVLAAGELPAWVATHTPRGEYVLAVEADSATTSALDDTAQRWLAALGDALPASRLAALAAKVTGVPRAQVYDFLQQQKN